MKIDIDIEKAGGNWCPYIGFKNQRFRLAPCEDEESAKWMAKQLEKAFENTEQRQEPVSLKHFVMCTNAAIDALVALEDVCKEMKLEKTSKQVKEVIGDLVCAKHEIEKYT